MPSEKSSADYDLPDVELNLPELKDLNCELPELAEEAFQLPEAESFEIDSIVLDDIEFPALDDIDLPQVDLDSELAKLDVDIAKLDSLLPPELRSNLEAMKSVMDHVSKGSLQSPEGAAALSELEVALKGQRALAEMVRSMKKVR